jgi:hypothetical protein
MPPKKGGKGKKGPKKDEGPEEGAPLTPEDEAKMYLATCQSLQMQLADRATPAPQFQKRYHLRAPAGNAPLGTTDASAESARPPSAARGVPCRREADARARGGGGVL